MTATNYTTVLRRAQDLSVGDLFQRREYFTVEAAAAKDENLSTLIWCTVTDILVVELDLADDVEETVQTQGYGKHLAHIGFTYSQLTLEHVFVTAKNRVSYQGENLVTIQTPVLT